MFRILAFGDVHVKEHNEFSRRETDGLTTILHECRDSLLWVASLVREAEIPYDIVVQLGDLLHDHELVNACSAFVAFESFEDIAAACLERGSVLVSLVGNHEWVRSPTVHTVPFLRIFGSLFERPGEKEIHGVKTLFLPYTDDVASVGKSISSFVERCSVDKMPALVFSHLDIRGCLYDSGGKCIKGISISDLGNAIMINGHHHTPGVMKNASGGTLLNAGSLMYKDFRDNFDHNSPARGALSITLNAGSDMEFVWLPNPKTSIYHTIKASSLPDLVDKLLMVYPSPSMFVRIVSTGNLSKQDLSSYEDGFKSIKIVESKVSSEVRLRSDSGVTPTHVWRTYLDSLTIPGNIDRDTVFKIGEDALQEMSLQAETVSYNDIDVTSWGARNFLSIDSVDLKVPKNPMVITVLGDVRDKTSLDSNGAGKSSLFEILPFTFWGNLMRPLSTMDSVICTANLEKGCLTYVTFNSGGKSYKIERTRKWESSASDSLRLYADGIDISKDTMPDTQKDINNILGMTIEEFSQLVFLSGQKHFSDFRNDTIRKSLLETFIGTGIYSLAESRLNRDKNTLSQKISSLEADISRLKLEVDRCRGEIDNIVYLRQEALVQSSLRKNDLRRKVEDASSRVKSLEDKRKLLLDQYGKVDLEIENSRNRMDRLRSRVMGFSSVISGNSSELDILLRTRGEKEELMKAGVCDKCGSRVSPKKLMGDLDSLEKRIDEIKKILPALQQKLGIAEEDYRNAEAEYHVTLQKRVEIDSKMSLLRTDIANAMSEADRCRKELEKDDPLDSAFEAALEEKKKYVEAKLSEIDRLSKELDVATKNFDHIQFVTDQFSATKLRSFVLDHALAQNNSKLSGLSVEFSGGEIQVQLSPTKQKRGGMVSKIDFLTNTGAPCFDLCSRGEKKRMDLMIQLSLSEMSRNYRNGFNILIVDEEDHGLDSYGQDRLVDLLSSLPLVVFLVSHQTKLQGAAGNSIVAIREGGKTVYEFHGEEISICQTS